MTQKSTTPSIQCPSPVLRPGAQGIARVAVDDVNAQLVVTFRAPFSSPPQPYLFDPLSYSLTGGQRLFPRILKAEPLNPTSPPASRGADGESVLLTLDGEGDFSIYTLTVNGPGIDPFFSSAKLRFRLACDDRFDCRPAVRQPSQQPELPVVIDYLAKDYSSFRQALLDFIPTRLPGWTERSEADIGMTLLELLAATADNLSYLQDRVANEAFLKSATQRRSVAGHLALIGYQMDEGASAHTWLQFEVNTTQMLAGDPGFQVSNQPGTVGAVDAAVPNNQPVIVFETMGKATLDPAYNAHNTLAPIRLYDWGNNDCCLPMQAVSAALVGRLDGLMPGGYLLFDDGTGHRDIVRLTASPDIVSLQQVSHLATTSPPMGSPPAGFITVVSWSPATPLHYDYCIADTTVSGNLVLATHGETISDETLRSLTDEQKAEVNAEIAARQSWQRIPRQRLRLANAPLAHLDPQTLARGMPPSAMPTVMQDPATSFTTRAPRSISTLKVTVDGVPWQEKASLLGSLPDAQVFRVEIDDAGEATVVFGDGTFGQRPPETATVLATYRLGGGQIGNIGADTLVVPRLDAPAPWLISVTNPLPAVGGRDLESRDHARRVAPSTSHQPLVAVSGADYEAAAAALTDGSGRQLIQRAKASFRWTGSWLTVTLAVDPLDAEGLTPELRRALLHDLAAKHLAGYDLEITGPIYLPVELDVEFCAAPGARPIDVQQSIQQALSDSELPGGVKGFFHPDNFTFGDNLYVSKIYAAVMAVPGVARAQITRLARLHAEEPESETACNLSQGFLAAGPDQIIRLDNDRNFPQNGTLTVQPRGT